MEKQVYKALVVALAVVISTYGFSDGAASDVPGIIGLDVVEDGACMAVYVPMEQGAALAGIMWYNNDESAVFPQVVVASGQAGYPEPVSEALPVADDVVGVSSGWSTLEFSEAVVAAEGGFYVVFCLPTGSEHVAYGAGGGAGLGYTSGANGYTGWLSSDGEDWLMLDEEFGIAFEPLIIPAEEGMAEKGLEEPEDVPVAFTALLNPAPNPFNPQTELKYQLKAGSHVKLSVYNVRGERVARLAQGWHEPGRYSVVWRGQSGNGHPVSSGTYFARFDADGVVQTQRLTLVK